MSHVHPTAPLFLVPPTWSNDQRGDYFERFVADLLSKIGCKCRTRLRCTGMEIDVLADSTLTSQRSLVQCKFQRDPLSANVIDLLLGQGSRRHDVRHLLLFSVSPLGKEAKGVADELERDPPEKTFNFHGPERILELLTSGSDATPSPTYEAQQGRSLAASHLLIHPDFPRVWLHEEHQDGAPVRLVVEAQEFIDLIQLAHATSACGVFEGLIFEPAFEAASASGSAAPADPDTVAPVPVADAVDDYRPCRPSDFIGRRELLSTLRSFLSTVVSASTKTRILALTGHSGFGKSSLVLKLQEQCRGRDLRDHIHLFAVDTRSARHKSFVSATIYKCLQSAVASGFLPKPPAPITVPSEGSVLQSASVRWALSELRARGRILVLFFDQFEEVLSKDELRPAFDALHAVALEVHADEGPLLLGFSWRLGITLTEDNPAYHLWHGLSDIRRSFEIGAFSEAEATSLISQFESASGETLLIPLKKRIRDQSQGLPWLIKKLSIHVFKQIKAGADQLDLLSQRLNVDTLFQDDLADLTPSQLECLKSIAVQSPVDLTKIADEYSHEVVNALVTRRLVIRTGGRLTPYWDIFRDFLRDGRVPAISWQWFPIVPASMAIPVLMQVQASRATLEELVERTGYSDGTVQNIVSDLQNVALIRRHEDGAYEVVSTELHTASEIAEFLGQQLREHAVTRALHAAVAPGGSLSNDDFKSLFSTLAHGRSQKTMDGYCNQFVSWIVFSGIVESRAQRLHRPTTKSTQLGVLRAARRERNIGFMAASEPDTTIDAASVVMRGRTDRTDLPRNACSDLVGLQLAIYDGRFVRPTSKLKSCETEADVRAVVLEQANQSPFLIAHRSVARSSIVATEEGLALGELLGREWSNASAVRYASAARRWQRAIASPASVQINAPPAKRSTAGRRQRNR
jgi:hypothetical protein